MADSDQKNKLIPVCGPVHYDLLGVSGEQFELLCYRLIRLKYPAVEKPVETNDCKGSRKTRLGGVHAFMRKSVRQCDGLAVTYVTVR